MVVKDWWQMYCDGEVSLGWFAEQMGLNYYEIAELLRDDKEEAVTGSRVE